jgi:hypothetical protein
MSSPGKDNEEPSSSGAVVHDEASGSGGESASSETQRPPAKRRLSSTVIEISDTDSDDSDVCAVNSYQASADEVKRIRGGEDAMHFLSLNSHSIWARNSNCLIFVYNILLYKFIILALCAKNIL